MNQTLKVLSRTEIARAWGNLSSYTIAQTRRDGVVQELVREVYDHGSAACVLLCDPARGMVILTRQMRFPPHLNGDSAMLIEVCAGLLDGDTPEVCAIREAEEETGYRVEGLTHAFDAYMSPGSLTEKVSCFTALYTPGDRVTAGGGLEHEGEDIEVIEMSFDAAFAMIGTGDIIDAKTIMLLQHARLAGIFG